ncbi:ATP-dependent DNA helicase RecQ [Herbiconiux sp.]|uniref:RecQ family ATP-dependent DNA helicase n=1 Tax=Herbiconiux sp. TaxID=1871186 RepID=UPI0025BA6A92|nr:ATP-dependent DNA helicase RecQ [Herbiconiux sp.]
MPTEHDPNTGDLRARITGVARDVFGWESLRPGQAEAVEAVVSGSDALAVMSTGYGKSALYQIAGHLLEGPTVVVSPLISLQADQVRHLQERTGTDDVVALNSAQSGRAAEAAWEAIASGEAEFLFLAPEQLARDEVIDELAALGVGLFVVDEAHCVSAWGHDFRPDYLRLGAVIERLGGPRILALTATGSAPVREEIVRRLGLRDPKLFVRGFDRPNIELEVVRHESEAVKERAVREQVLDAVKPGLVYVSTRADTERLAEELEQDGMRAAAYHGGLRAAERRGVQDRFHADELDVVVATSAFGMGIDKPNVRFVVHADITDSIDSYYQEVGRAGRDGEPARATLHYRQEDLALRRFFAGGRTAPSTVEAVLGALAPRGRRRRMPLADLTEASGLSRRTAANVVNLLIEAQLADEDAKGVSLARKVSTAEAVDAVREVADQRRRIEESRLAMMRGYAETRGCRRQYLLEYFGDDLTEPCGRCDTCASGSAGEREREREERERELQEREAQAQADAFREGERVRHEAWGEGEIVSVEADRLTAFFEVEGYRVLSLEVIDARPGLLTPV